MSKWDKLIARICNLSKDLRFTQLQRVLETYGYRMDAPRSGSSHYTFRKQGKSPITIPKHEPIKKIYVEMVRQIVESEVKNDEDGVEIHEPDSLEDYSGQFKLRIPRSLHRALAEHSQREGISMNQYCVYLLSRNDAMFLK